MLQIEDYDKLDKVSKSRIDKVLQQIEGLNMRFPLAEIVKGTGADKGMVSAYLNAKKPISDKFYSTFMEKFSKEEYKTEKTMAGLSNEKLSDLSTETIRDMARTCVGLSEVVKVIADNNRSLIQKINFGAAPKIGEILYPYLDKISRALAEKYQLKSDDVLVELGTILLEDLLEKKEQGNVVQSHNSGK